MVLLFFVIGPFAFLGDFAGFLLQLFSELLSLTAFRCQFALQPSDFFPQGIQPLFVFVLDIQEDLKPHLPVLHQLPFQSGHGTGKFPYLPVVVFPEYGFCLFCFLESLPAFKFLHPFFRMLAPVLEGCMYFI